MTAISKSLPIDEQVQQVLTNYGLDFTIEKLPMVAKRDLITSELIDSDYFGLYNDKSGEIINTVKSGYVVSQNDEIIKPILTAAQSFGNLSIHNAGSLNGGRKVFVQLAIDGHSAINGDKITRYITIIDSNDGSTSLAIGIGDRTFSCQNQFFMFAKTAQLKYRHSQSITRHIQLLEEAIETNLALSLRVFEMYEKFESTPVTKKLVHDLVRHLTKIDRTMDLSDVSTRSVNIMDGLYNNIEHQMNDKGQNLWGLHSGVTRWTTFDKTAPKRDLGRTESLMVGANYNTAMKSFDFAMNHIGEELVF